MLLFAWFISSLVAVGAAVAMLGVTGRAAQLSPYTRRTRGLALMPLLSAVLFATVALPAWQSGLAGGALAGLIPAGGCMAGGLMLLSRQWRFIEKNKPVAWVIFHLTFGTAVPPFVGTGMVGVMLA